MPNIKNIYKGFTGGKPTEAWYKERMDICASCPLNTKNMKREDISLLHATQMKTICKGGGVCTACGCCIAEKASVKAEECGLVKKGQTPLWTKLETNIQVNPNLKVKVTEPSDVFLDLLGGQLRVKKTFNPETEKKVVMKILLEDKSGLHVHRAEAGCSCTATNINKINNFKTELTLEISTIGFSQQVTERTVVLHTTKGNQLITLQFTKNDEL